MVRQVCQGEGVQGDMEGGRVDISEVGLREGMVAMEWDPVDTVSPSGGAVAAGPGLIQIWRPTSHLLVLQAG